MTARPAASSIRLAAREALSRADRTDIAATRRGVPGCGISPERVFIDPPPLKLLPGARIAPHGWPRLLENLRRVNDQTAPAAAVHVKPAGVADDPQRAVRA